MIYQWKPKTNYKKDPQVIGEELDKIKKQYGGRITPIQVLNKAKNKRSTLHDLFEWDNSKAAQKYRISQARDIIRAVVVVLDKTNEEETKTVRAFSSVEIESESGKHQRVYVSVFDALNNTDMRDQVLAEVMDAISEAQAKLAVLQDLMKKKQRKKKTA